MHLEKLTSPSRYTPQVLKHFFRVLMNVIHKPGNGPVNIHLILVKYIGNDRVLEPFPQAFDRIQLRQVQKRCDVGRRHPLKNGLPVQHIRNTKERNVGMMAVGGHLLLLAHFWPSGPQDLIRPDMGFVVVRHRLGPKYRSAESRTVSFDGRVSESLPGT